MKKILIVEDTEENLEAAKTFFSTVTGFEFIYAVNRSEAETFLPKVDAVLTDRSLPFLSNESISNYNNLQYDESSYKCALEGNGYCVLIQAVSKGIPALMLSSHSDTTLLITVSKEESIAMLTRFNGLDIYQFGTDISVGFHGERERFHGGKLPKDMPSTWEFAWNRLLQQMEKSNQSVGEQ